MVPYEQQINQLKSKLISYKAIEVPRAVASALNKTGQRVVTRTVKGVAKSLVVPQKEVRKRVYLSRANAKNMRVRVRNYYRGISAINLKARDTGKGGWLGRKGRGVRAQGKRHYPNAFIAYGRKGNRHVFERQGVDRFPLKVQRIQIKGAVDDIAPKVAERVLKQDFERLLVHDLKYRLRKFQV